uniref:Uncharacterized protein n=1 Tax=Anopheles culicifacies TaxID=139723 RepID=A0A182M5U1_9DIPT
MTLTYANSAVGWCMDASGGRSDADLVTFGKYDVLPAVPFSAVGVGGAAVFARDDLMHGTSNPSASHWTNSLCSANEAKCSIGKSSELMQSMASSGSLLTGTPSTLSGTAAMGFWATLRCCFSRVICANIRSRSAFSDAFAFARFLFDAVASYFTLLMTISAFVSCPFVFTTNSAIPGPWSSCSATVAFFGMSHLRSRRSWRGDTYFTDSACHAPAM